MKCLLLLPLVLAKWLLITGIVVGSWHLFF